MSNDNENLTEVAVREIIAAQRAPGEDRPTEILKYFTFDDLDGKAREIACHYAQLAAVTVLMAPSSAERTAGLRKLLEAKDCAVRAVAS